MNKICSRCKKDKSNNEFYIRKDRPIGLTPCCKDCWSEIRKDKWKSNAIYRKKIAGYTNRFRLQNKNYMHEYNAQYSNDPYNKKSRAKRVLQRMRTDINFRIRNRLGVALRSQLKRQGANKSDHTMVLIGCSVEFLKKYIENQFTEGMTWDNYGRKGWSIDHIRPCASFDLTKPEEQRTCFHYTNLRPLWESDNVKKSSWYDGKLHRIKNLTYYGNSI